MHLDHITIRTNELALNRDFLTSILPLVEGPRPASIVAMVDGFWLYHKDRPLVHLIQSPYKANHEVNEHAEAIDHFAFIMNIDYQEFKDKLIQRNIPFQRNHLLDVNRKRIFFRTPCNVLIETIFELG